MNVFEPADNGNGNGHDPSSSAVAGSSWAKRTEPQAPSEVTLDTFHAGLNAARDRYVGHVPFEQTPLFHEIIRVFLPHNQPRPATIDQGMEALCDQLTITNIESSASATTPKEREMSAEVLKAFGDGMKAARQQNQSLPDFP